MSRSKQWKSINNLGFLQYPCLTDAFPLVQSSVFHAVHLSCSVQTAGRSLVQYLYTHTLQITLQWCSQDSDQQDQEQDSEFQDQEEDQDSMFQDQDQDQDFVAQDQDQDSS